LISFKSKIYRLTEKERAVLYATYKELDRHPNKHTPSTKISRWLIGKTRGGVEGVLNAFVAQGLLQKKPTHGGMTYAPTSEGADLAEYLYPYLSVGIPVEAQKIADDMDIDPSFVKEIFNIPSSINLPVFSYQFESDNIKKNQRIISLLSLYYNNIQNNKQTFSRSQLEKILESCNISAENFDKAFRRRPWRNYVEISGRTYRILPAGLYKAKKMIKQLLKL